MPTWGLSEHVTVRARSRWQPIMTLTVTIALLVLVGVLVACLITASSSSATTSTNLVAGMFGFQRAEYFEVEDGAVRSAPTVDFS